MATTASGITIPGSSPTTTAATPIQDHWNNLGKSLNGRVVVPVASITARAALVVALAAEGYTISASNPLYTHRADAPVGSELEVTVDGTTWRTVPSTDPWITYTATRTGFAVGGGTTSTIWRREGDLIRVRYAFIFGAGATAPTAPSFSLPVTSVALVHPYPLLVGIGDLFKASTATTYSGPPVLVNTTTAQITYGLNPLALVTDTVPWTWVLNDAMTGEFTYRPA